MKIFILIFFSFLFFGLNAQISVFHDFENGSVDLLESDTILNKISIQPSLVNDSNTTRCWFYFGITNFDTTKNLTISYKYFSPVAAPENPVYSYDQKNWLRLNAEPSADWTKQVSFKFSEDTVFFATGYPYTYTDICRYIDSIASNPYIDTSTLTYSEAGLRVPMITIRDTNNNLKDMVWITGRLHAFESTMNYTLEGTINFLISEDERAVNARKNTIFFIIPMTDVDNVYIGASGRMQKPVDFNRDWSENPHWNAIKSIQHLITETNEKYNYRIFLDYHSTYPGTTTPKFGIFNEYKFDQTEHKNLRKFFKIFEKNSGYELDEIDGEMNPTYSDAFSGGVIYPNIKVTDFSTTVECDWTINQNGKPLTIKELRVVGELLGITLCDYLAE